MLLVKNYLLSLYLKLLDQLGLLRKSKRTFKLFVNSKPFNVPIIDRLGYNNFFQDEFWMEQLMSLFLNKTSYFIDIGSNTGQCLLKFRSLTDRIPYVAFDANPDCNTYLSQLIQENNFKNTSIAGYGLSDTNHQTKLYFDFNNPGELAATTQFNQQTYSKDVTLKACDVLLKEFNIPKKELILIKIDVEKSELSVLRSLLPLNLHHLIILEVLPAKNSPEELRINQINSLLHSDYLIYFIGKKNEKLSHLKSIDSIPPSGFISGHDYLIVPNSIKDQLLSDQFANFIIT